MDPSIVWQEFLAQLQQAPLPTSLIRLYPHLEALLETLKANLEILRPHLLSTVEQTIQPE